MVSWIQDLRNLTRIKVGNKHVWNWLGQYGLETYL
jgi:hypothetical protein